MKRRLKRHDNDYNDTTTTEDASAFTNTITYFSNKASNYTTLSIIDDDAYTNDRSFSWTLGFQNGQTSRR